MNVAIYFNGNLISNETTIMPDNDYGIKSSLMPSSALNTTNSIFALRGMTLPVDVAADTTTAVSLNGTTISFAIISDGPIWLAGWTQTDMSAGAGPQFGQSIGQLASTFEATEHGTYFPNSLPASAISLPFQLQILGGLMS